MRFFTLAEFLPNPRPSNRLILSEVFVPAPLSIGVPSRRVYRGALFRFPCYFPRGGFYKKMSVQNRPSRFVSRVFPGPLEFRVELWKGIGACAGFGAGEGDRELKEKLREPFRKFFFLPRRGISHLRPHFSEYFLVPI